MSISREVLDRHGLTKEKTAAEQADSFIRYMEPRVAFFDSILQYGEIDVPRAIRGFVVSRIAGGSVDGMHGALMMMKARIDRLDEGSERLVMIRHGFELTWAKLTAAKDIFGRRLPEKTQEHLDHIVRRNEHYVAEMIEGARDYHREDWRQGSGLITAIHMMPLAPGMTRGDAEYAYAILDAMQRHQHNTA